MSKAKMLEKVKAKIYQAIKQEYVISSLFVSVTGFGLHSIDKLYITKQKPNSDKVDESVIDLSKDFQEYHAAKD